MSIPPNGNPRPSASSAKNPLLAAGPALFTLTCGAVAARLGWRLLGWFGLTLGLVVGSLAGVVVLTVGLFLWATRKNPPTRRDGA